MSVGFLLGAYIKRIMKRWLGIMVLAAVLLRGQSLETIMRFNEPMQERSAPAPSAEVKREEPMAFAPEFSAGVEASGRYMYEGWARNDRPVGIVQAEFSESIGYLGFWGVYDFNDRLGRRWRFEEERFYAGVHCPLTQATAEKPVELDLNWTCLRYPRRSRLDSAELSLGLNAPEIYRGRDWRLGFGLALVHDYELETTAMVPHLEYEHFLNDGGTLSALLRGEMHWGDTGKVRRLTDGGCDGNAFHAAVLRAELSWRFHKNWEAVPYVATALHPDRRARQAARDSALDSEAVLWGGLRVSCHF
jgi:hypothetical protein